MISLNIKTLPIWTESIKERVRNCKKHCHLHPILGSPTSKGCFLFPRSWQNQRAFTIGIQTLIQCQSMFSCDHNGVISMDATFGTNDMKFHLFILMGFDVHHIGVPLTWIITS
jgi:hypothetical protein